MRKKFELEMVAESSKPEKKKVSQSPGRKKRMSYQEKQEGRPLRVRLKRLKTKS